MTGKKSMIVSAIACAFLVAGNASGQAADGAALYKKRCAQCHGANGEGRPAMNAPALKGDTMSAEDMQQLLTQGASGKKAPHSRAISGLNADQAKAIVDYVKTL
jgi:mono/diheme cytochrome c family protein